MPLDAAKLSAAPGFIDRIMGGVVITTIIIVGSAFLFCLPRSWLPEGGKRPNEQPRDHAPQRWPWHIWRQHRVEMRDVAVRQARERAAVDARIIEAEHRLRSGPIIDLTRLDGP